MLVLILRSMVLLHNLTGDRLATLGVGESQSRPAEGSRC
eukprot:SAG31_NODE_3374_length_4350_cov_4.769162_4_plen_39_part_00